MYSGLGVSLAANHALQRTRRERRGCNPCVPCAGSLSLGRSVGAAASICPPRKMKSQMRSGPVKWMPDER